VSGVDRRRDERQRRRRWPPAVAATGGLATVIGWLTGHLSATSAEVILALLVILVVPVVLVHYNLVFHSRRVRGKPDDPYVEDNEVSIGLRRPAAEPHGQHEDDAPPEDRLQAG